MATDQKATTRRPMTESAAVEKHVRVMLDLLAAPRLVREQGVTVGRTGDARTQRVVR
ncbi:putative protein OS=Tsukamurella paurometabola (strain ATCC 8368 / DSM / CCUG 35730 /CIP 100753 / JCM 10117 / KCTC 9821 / NBRC 16120 / NCIMB 702349/ NCTC 13040) OX=521096 GN=Tpau_0258 PE=4 SV=1 [Tsukamurella paurometabola]|uniref:Uncharacterized protein n=1 Tax=Tsukamurella paurometabola (strain ATCC 8368 / DSM 20162 / CCUG 35730 / CIP 100753 / JCM 10117 / KCTC 9821 / NBRC 16120 / NCIMB 702349 / NCTC 13040) TaxID=521096 RepID=D5UQS5_TSUPD|nr:hypothetical protein Tpau_0258 [Tsukamurella paurometabola DSM 20162]SUP42161.1 Uncharacterised protein [Tsukamurella paurometabola]